MRGAGGIDGKLRDGHSALEPPSHPPYHVRSLQHACNGRLPPQSLEVLVALFVDVDHRVRGRSQGPFSGRVGAAGRTVPQTW